MRFNHFQSESIENLAQFLKNNSKKEKLLIRIRNYIPQNR